MYENVVIMPFKSGTMPLTIPSIGKTFADASYKIKKPNEDNFAFELVVSGKGFIDTGKELRPLVAGDVFISFPHKPRFYYADSKDPFVKYWFIAIGNLPKYILKSYEIYDSVYHAPDCLPIFENLLNEAKSGKDYQTVCRLGAKAILQIADTLKFSTVSQSYVPEYLIQAKTFIDKNYSQAVTIEQVAQYAHVSPSQLTRTFKKHYGETPYEYLLNLKIEAAKILLSNSALSVKQIAFNLGFCDEHYFSGLFKKKTGATPSKYHI